MKPAAFEGDDGAVCEAKDAELEDQAEVHVRALVVASP